MPPTLIGVPVAAAPVFAPQDGAARAVVADSIRLPAKSRVVFMVSPPISRLYAAAVFLSLPVMKRAQRSPIIMAGALVLPDTRVGMIELSPTRRPVTPRTRNWSSTTAMRSLSGPLLAVPTGGNTVLADWRTKARRVGKEGRSRWSPDH